MTEEEFIKLREIYEGITQSLIDVGIKYQRAKSPDSITKYKAQKAVLRAQRATLLRAFPELEPARRHKAVKIFVFPNGNVAVTDSHGRQVPELQGSVINYDYLRRLAKVVAQDDPEALGLENLPVIVGTSLTTYIKHYKKYGVDEPPF